MKKRKTVKSLIAILAMISIVSLCFMGADCSTDHYPDVTKSIPVADGGTLTVFAERELNGDISGDTRSYDYYVKGTYDGDKKVEEIKITWVISVQFKRETSSSQSSGLTVGTTSVGGNQSSGSTSEYETLSVEKHWTNTNGAKEAYYGPSNYVVWPYEQANSHSLQNTAYLKIAGHATPFSVTAAV